MANYNIVDTERLDTDLKGVADTIRMSGGASSELSFPEDFNTAIAQIFPTEEVGTQADIISQIKSALSGKAANTPNIQPLEVTENGTYTAPDRVDGYSPVTVSVVSSGESIDGIPTGYARADYIQFNGKQIIDTGIICNQNTTIKLAFTREKSAQHYLLGVASSDNTAAVTAYLGGNWRFGDKSTSKNPNTNEDMIYSAVLSGTEITITSSKTAISGVNEFETIGSLLLGTCRSSDGAVADATYEGKIFFFTIWQGEEQLLKLVPVVNAEGRYRFFDMVSKTFFDSITETPLDGGNL